MFAIVMPLGELRGGVERMLLNLLRANQGNTRAEYAIAFLEDGPLVEQIQAMGYRADVFPSGRLRNPLSYVKTVLALKRWFRNVEAKAVLSWAAKGHLYAGPAARQLGIPTAWYVHSLPDGYWMDRLITALHADVVLCCGRTAEQAQRKMWPHRETQVAYIAVDLDEFDPERLPGPEAARQQLELPEGKPLVVMVARLQRWKGVHVFVEAAAIVRESHAETQFFVVGGEHWAEPNYPEELRAQSEALGVANAVRFVGLQSNVPMWMQAADVLVHASFDEPTGTVIIEGMALGKPVVAARSGGPMEFIEDGACGRLAMPGNANEVAAAISDLLSDPAQRARLGAEARRRAAYFSADRLADDVAAAMTRIARAETSTA